MNNHRLLFLLLFVSSVPLYGQSAVSKEYSQIAYPKRLQECLTPLADDYSEGRASGTTGAQLTERFVAGKFEALGLKPFRSLTFTRSFPFCISEEDGYVPAGSDTLILRNVIGYIPAVTYSEDYIIVCASYDYLGTINGVVYNGADDNASGITALVTLAEMTAEYAKNEHGPAVNIVFIAFDGKEHDMAGSRRFIKDMGISPKRIRCVMSLDKIGTSLEAPTSNSKYLIVLCNEAVKQNYKFAIQRINLREDFNMCVDYTYYGSRDFTKLFYRSADHYQFSKLGIPSMLFTSGINRHTMKPTDDAGIIDYEALSERVRIVFDFLVWLQKLS